MRAWQTCDRMCSRFPCRGYKLFPKPPLSISAALLLCLSQPTHPSKVQRAVCSQTCTSMCGSRLAGARWPCRRAMSRSLSPPALPLLLFLPAAPMLTRPAQWLLPAQPQGPPTRTLNLSPKDLSPALQASICTLHENSGVLLSRCCWIAHRAHRVPCKVAVVKGACDAKQFQPSLGHLCGAVAQ